MMKSSRMIRWGVTLGSFGLILALVSLVIMYFRPYEISPFFGLTFFLWAPLVAVGFILGAVADRISKGTTDKISKPIKIIITVLIFAWLLYSLVVAMGVI